MTEALLPYFRTCNLSPQRPYSVVFSCFNYFFQYVKELYPIPIKWSFA